MEEILSQMTSSSNFYKVGEQDEIKNLSFSSEEEAYNYFKSENNYGGAWSKLSPGMDLVTKDMNQPTLYISDFLLDEGKHKSNE